MPTVRRQVKTVAMKINDIITGLLGTAVVGLGMMVITVYQDRGSQGEINKGVEAAIAHMEEEFEADIAVLRAIMIDKFTALQGGMMNRFTSEMGQMLEDRQWDFLHRLATLEARNE